MEALPSRGEIPRRILNLQKHLLQRKIDAALILQKADLLYFAGTVQQAYLFIPADRDPLLMVRRHFQRARTESPIHSIVGIENPKEMPEILRKNGYDLPQRLGLEYDVLPVNLYFACREIFKEASFEDVSGAVREIRSIKSPFEIEMIREASRLADRVAMAARDILKEGESEVSLAGRIEAEARRLGHQGLVRMRMWGGETFYGHMMAGPSAAVASFPASPTGGTGLGRSHPQGPGFRTVRANEPILLDYVFIHNGYLADHTRIFALKGLSRDLLAAHEAMLTLQEMLMKSAKPGVSSGSLYEAAVSFAADRGYGEFFMGADAQRVRFVGHGIGLELDEYPVLGEKGKTPLQEGMVIALEPKLVFPGIGVVGIENTHVVTRDGLQRLTQFPDEVVIL
ncbi:MAG: aminopeptidase P family protein [Desulfobacteraceae bacterium]|nr:MAG: aminopeptidase P family protein [Desulfobacteraceae bacterium]